MNPRAQVWLWLAQRISAVVLAVCVAVHLFTMIIAVQGGLSAAEIAARVSGHGGWLGFYLIFTIAAAVHAPIGLRTVLTEWSPLSRATVDVSCAAFAIALLWLGVRAVLAVYAA